MPAMRAAPSTSPFLASPFNTRSRVAGFITTRPSATATRSVAGLCETSTMRAAPLFPKWVSLRGISGALCFRLVGREQLARRRRHVLLAHQTLAHEEDV